MKCKKQPEFLIGKPTPINDVWEVRLPRSLFESIQHIARRRKVSYSTITRYCVFRLASHENLRLRRLFQRAQAAIRQSQLEASAIHRHMVCLYGEDVKWLKIAAMALGVSVSELIRIALWLYLPLVAMDTHSKKHVSARELFWRGIKHWLCIHLKPLNLFRAPAIRQYTFASFLPQHWWRPVLS